MEKATVVPTTASTRSFTATTSNGAMTRAGTVVVGAEVVVVVAVGGAGGIVVASGGAVSVTPATCVGTERTVVRIGFLVVFVTRLTVGFVVRFTVVDVFVTAEAGTSEESGARSVNPRAAAKAATDPRERTVESRKWR